jgi:hypothetical protein
MPLDGRCMLTLSLKTYARFFLQIQLGIDQIRLSGFGVSDIGMDRSCGLRGLQHHESSARPVAACLLDYTCDLPACPWIVVLPSLLLKARKLAGILLRTQSSQQVTWP